LTSAPDTSLEVSRWAIRPIVGFFSQPGVAGMRAMTKQCSSTLTSATPSALISVSRSLARFHWDGVDGMTSTWRSLVVSTLA